MSSTIHAYNAAVSIDAAADFLLIDPASSGAYKKISRNVLLGISSQPLGLTDIQSPTNKTFDNTNTLTIKDGSFTLQNSSSVTKQAVFSLASITAGQTRTITLPDSNTTLPIASQIITFSGPTNARTYTLADSSVTIADTSTAQALTTKTITASSNILGGVTMTLGSDADGDVYYRSSSVLTRLAKGTAGQVLTMNGGATAPSWAASTSQVTLLKANSGTDTTTSAVNVDTYALSGLTAKDTLMVRVTIEEATQTCSPLKLYSNTDSTIIVDLNQTNNITAGTMVNAVFYITQDASSVNSYTATGITGTQTLNGLANGSAGVAWTSSINMATAWTGSWTLALRKTGMTSGGTTSWSWAVYKLAGQ